MYDIYDISMPFEEINRVLELSLSHNDFVFNDHWLLQTSDTAMGKKYASSLANIFMANLEDDVLRKAECKPLVMFRFIYDHFNGRQKWTVICLTLYNTPHNKCHLKSLQKRIHFR